MPTGRPHLPELKAEVVMQVISGEKTLSDVATEYDLNPNLVRKWRNKFEQEAYSKLGCRTTSGDSHRKGA